MPITRLAVLARRPAKQTRRQRAGVAWSLWRCFAAHPSHTCFRGRWASDVWPKAHTNRTGWSMLMDSVGWSRRLGVLPGPTRPALDGERKGLGLAHRGRGGTSFPEARSGNCARLAVAIGESRLVLRPWRLARIRACLAGRFNSRTGKHPVLPEASTSRAEETRSTTSRDRQAVRDLAEHDRPRPCRQASAAGVAAGQAPQVPVRRRGGEAGERASRGALAAQDGAAPRRHAGCESGATAARRSRLKARGRLRHS